MKRPRAAEGDECEVAWIASSLDRDHPNRTQHLRIHDVDHVSRLQPVERLLRGRAIQLQAVREPRRKPPEQEIRVGHRRPPATEPVARRPRIGTGALGPDP